ncbi:GtrA family protein [Umezawaea sp. NPDC059074]|uniref:GtrA family protein n=1 Tax=Umezawaea sp. NPDC059074 TaxID=3346716 RepID=UPI0036868DA3
MTTTAPTSWFHRLTRFAGVGVLNTVLFLGVYLAFRTALPTTAASLVATALTTVTGTIANGRVTFGVTGPIALRGHLKSLVVTGLGLVITTGAVTVAGTGGSVDELGVLIAASAVAGVVRFALMGRWVFPATA